MIKMYVQLNRKTIYKLSQKMQMVKNRNKTM